MPGWRLLPWRRRRLPRGRHAAGRPRPAGPPVASAVVASTPVPAVLPAPAVALGFRDGSELALPPTDPRVRAFRAIAGELARSG